MVSSKLIHVTVKVMRHGAFFLSACRSCISFLCNVHSRPHQVASPSENTSSVSTVTGSSSVFNAQDVGVWRRSRLRRERESVAETSPIVSRLELAVAADGDVRGGGSCSSALGLRAAVAGLRAAQVARGGRQQVGVMAVLLVGAVRWVLRGHEGRILLQSGWRERRERWEWGSTLES